MLNGNLTLGDYVRVTCAETGVKVPVDEVGPVRPVVTGRVNTPTVELTPGNSG